MRVAIADNTPVLRHGLVLLLKDLGVEVVGEASDGTEIVDLARRTSPDVVVLDIVMPPPAENSCGGLIAAERLRSEFPDIGILLFSAFGSPQYAERLFACPGNGGRGYLIKDRVMDQNTLVEAIESVGSGGLRLDREIANTLIRAQRRRAGSPELTEREWEVLQLVAEGLSSAGISARLGIAQATVDRHVSNIFDKLGLPSTKSTTRRSLAILKCLEMRHVCNSQCSTPCDVVTW